MEANGGDTHSDACVNHKTNLFMLMYLIPHRLSIINILEKVLKIRLY